MSSKIIEKAFKKVPLKSKLLVANKMTMIDAIVEAGYRKDVAWDSTENVQLAAIEKCARELTENQLNLIKTEKHV